MRFRTCTTACSSLFSRTRSPGCPGILKVSSRAPSVSSVIAIGVTRGCPSSGRVTSSVVTIRPMSSTTIGTVRPANPRASTITVTTIEVPASAFSGTSARLA